MLLFGFLVSAALAGPVSSAGTKPAEAPSGKLIDRIAAVVNGRPILLSELEEAQTKAAAEMKRMKKPEAAAADDFRKRVLDQMINQKLVEQEIDRRGLTVTDAGIDRVIETVMRQNGMRSIDELKKALRDEGMTLDDYRASLKKQMESNNLLNSAVRSRVQVSDQDVEAAYKRKKPEKQEWLVNARMIYKEKPKATRKGMERMIREMTAGVPFETVANRETEGPGKGDGGSIGWVSPDDIQPELGKELRMLETGKISKVIETTRGFYLLYYTERKSFAPKEIKDLRENIREEIVKTETDRNFDLFIRGLREKANIQVMIP